MPSEIKCGMCGAKNPLTSLFCVNCGEKLELSEIRASHLDEESGSALRFMARLIRLCISLAIIGGAGLCLWPRVPAGEVGDTVAQHEGRMKMARLHDAAAGGLDFTGGMAETEINAYLMSLLQESRGNGATPTFADLSDINIDISEDSVTVVAVASLGVVQVSYLLEGLPQAGDQGFVFAIQRAELGHLPIPGPGQAWVAGRVRAIFAGMEPERNVLESAAAFKLKDEQLWIKIRGS